MYGRIDARSQRVHSSSRIGAPSVATSAAGGRAWVFMCVVFLAIFGLTLTSATSGAGIATAQSEPNQPATAGHNYSLTIHKFDGDPLTEKVGAGAPQPQPLGGIKFQINQLEGLNITDQAELNALAQSDPRMLTEQTKYPLGESKTAVTAEDGKATFSDLKRGVYLVREQPSRVGNTRYSVATPFLVAVPDMKGNGDVVVKAKNQPIVATKSILGGVPGTPEAERIAEEHKRGEVRYRLETTMPAPDVRGKLYQLIVADPLDKHLDFKSVTNAFIANGEKTVELREGEDFKVDLEGAPRSGGFDYADKTVKITLTDKGLATAAKMRDGHPEARAVFDLHATLKSDTPEGTKISNTALSFPDGHDYWLVLAMRPPEWRVETNEVGFIVGPAPSVPTDPEEQLPVQPGEWPDWIFAPLFPLPPGATNHPLPGHRPQCPGCVPGAPGKPGSGTTAGAQGQPAGSAQPGAEGSRGLPGIIDRLPMTGANVMGLLVAGIVLVLVGFFVVGRRRRREEDNDAQTHRDPGANRAQEGSANE